jgi:hypothetical protein
MSQVIVCMGEPYPEIKREVSAEDVFKAIGGMSTMLGRLVSVVAAAQERERDLSDANRKLIDRLTAVDNEMLAMRNGREAATQSMIVELRTQMGAYMESILRTSPTGELRGIQGSLDRQSAVLDNIRDAVIPVPTTVVRERAARRAKSTTKKRGKKNVTQS